MFKTRLASGIVLMAITIALMVYGGYPLFWVITAISLIGLFELYKAARMEKTPPALAGYISSIVTDILLLNDEYEYFVWLIYIGAWGSDTCAYCVGKLIGKHKIPSELSPNKTIEGCLGGIAGAALIGFIFAAVFYNDRNVWWQLPVIGAVSSVISQIGDLAASAIKRNHNIKDYGKLIPGHGGILDRFDSIIFTAPVVYYLIRFMM